MIKNRKGDILPDNALSIIIAVLILAMLVFGIVKLYSLSANNESDNAKNLANLIEGKLGALSEGQTTSFLIQGFKQDSGESSNWGIVGWSKNELGRPEKCELKSCICVCPIPGGADVKNNFAQSCQSTGFCRFFDSSSLKIQRVSGDSCSQFKALDYYVIVPNNVADVKVSKQKDSIEFSSADPTKCESSSGYQGQ